MNIQLQRWHGGKREYITINVEKPEPTENEGNAIVHIHSDGHYPSRTYLLPKSTAEYLSNLERAFGELSGMTQEDYDREVKPILQDGQQIRVYEICEYR